MKLLDFFSYKLNRRILTAFMLIITIPGIVSFWVTSAVIRRTLQKEIEAHLKEAATVYFKELDAIERKCIDIARVYSEKNP